LVLDSNVVQELMQGMVSGCTLLYNLFPSCAVLAYVSWNTKKTKKIMLIHLRRLLRVLCPSLYFSAHAHPSFSSLLLRRSAGHAFKFSGVFLRHARLVSSAFAAFPEAVAFLADETGVADAAVFWAVILLSGACEVVSTVRLLVCASCKRCARRVGSKLEHDMTLSLRGLLNLGTILGGGLQKPL